MVLYPLHSFSVMITKVVLKKRLQNQHKGNLYRFEEPFLSLITKLYTVCQLFAAAPILDTPHRKRRILRYVHYVWCSIVLIYISVVNIHYINRIHKPLVTIVQIFFSTELFNNPLIVASIILSMYYNGEEYRNIPHELLRIYKVYRNLQLKVSNGNALFRVLHKEMLIMSGAVSTVVSSCFLVDYLRTEPVLIAYLLNSSVFSFANILITFNITQFWLALRVVYQLYRGFNEIMKERLKCFSSINLETSELASKEVYAYTTEISWYQREFHSSRKEASRSYEILDSIRNIYFDLDTIMIRLTKVFGITMLLNLFGSVLSLSVQVFAVFKFFDVENFLGDALVEVYNRVLWLFIHLARILLILITNNAIIEEKCRTSFVLNQLHITSREMERAINRFLLKLIVHQSPVLLCGIVELDLLVVCGIAGVVTNYFIFLVQIDLGIITISEQNLNTTDTPINNLTK